MKVWIDITAPAHVLVFRPLVDIMRERGAFPRAGLHDPGASYTDNKGAPITVWCSNDYLSMGQHPKVIDAMVETATRMGAGAAICRIERA